MHLANKCTICTNFKMIEIKIQNGCWQRSDSYKMSKRKGAKNLITAKTELPCRTLKARKGIINAYESKTKVQTNTKYNVMHRLAQVPKEAKDKWQ